MGGGAKLSDKIKISLENTPVEFPQNAVVACQGVKGAYSQLACEKLFTNPNIIYVNTFDAVFNAVDKGMCGNGILPLENSLCGSVAEVYDLMKKHHFYIVRSVKMKINHALLANHGVISPQIKEIYSHEQALGQCSEFIKKLKNVKIINCVNTASAARAVSESKRNDAAAIANPVCAHLYDLSVISNSIQNNDNNYTRFICISKELQIYPQSNKISLMFTVPHKPGALYGFLEKFASLGVNLTKLESRPISGSDFEFMFYVEMDTSVSSNGIKELMDELENTYETFVFLGNYKEV
jgi:chorismate mutase/prephenate dehydratase